MAAIGQKSRGNAQAFRSLGHEVQLVTRDFMPYHFHEGADLIFSGIPVLICIMKPTLPTILQAGGYGVNTVLPGGRFMREVRNLTEAPTFVTVLDPNYYDELRCSWLDKKVDYDKILMVPNGLPQQLREQPVESGEPNPQFTVLNPAGDMRIKRPEKFVEGVKLVEKRGYPIKFKFLSKSRHSYRLPIEWLDVDSLDILPVQPYAKMVELYNEADVVAPFSYAEILPNTPFEAFHHGKPLVCNMIGKIQTIPVEDVERAVRDFGMPIAEFDEKWRDRYFTGDHYLQAKTPEDFAEKIIYLYEHEDERKRLSRRSKEWVSYWWHMESKCELLLDRLEEMTHG